jgi:hypothetical protein
LSSAVSFLVFGKWKTRKMDKNAKNEVFEFKMSDFWMKKWTSWGCSIFEHADQVLNGFRSLYGTRDRYIFITGQILSEI